MALIGAASDAKLRDRINDASLGAKIFLSRAQPWSVLADREAYEKPTDLQVAVARARRNLEKFKVNYIVAVAATVACSLALHPKALLILGGVATVSALTLTRRVTLAGRELSTNERAIAVAVGGSLVVFVFTGAGSVLLMGLFLGGAAVAGHAVCYSAEELFSDEAI